MPFRFCQGGDAVFISFGKGACGCLCGIVVGWVLLEVVWWVLGCLDVDGCMEAVVEAVCECTVWVSGREGGAFIVGCRGWGVLEFGSQLVAVPQGPGGYVWRIRSRACL